jgi:hypothetical protein
MAAAKPKKGLRDRLLARERPSLRIPLADEDITQPGRRVALAEEAWRTTHLDQSDKREQRIAAARKELDAAIAALDECHFQVTVTALPPEEFEKLAEEHPARKGEDEAWNEETFPRALFFASAGDDLSAQEWGEFLDDRCSQAERDMLLLAAQQVNVRAPSLAIPKD